MGSGAAVAGLLVALLAPAPAFAQVTDEQLWTTATVTFSISEKVKLGSEAEIRFSEAAQGPSEVEIGGDAELDTGGVTLGGGYFHVWSYNKGVLTNREHRLRQQVGTNLTRLAGGQLAGRLRLEERWRDDGDDMMLRLRPRLTWTRPIGPDRLAVRVLHESFVNLNRTDWGGEARYDRMRNQVALRRRFGSAVTGEFGYLHQYRFSGTKPDDIVHALTAAVTLGF
jgi:hypothetical protein